MDREATLKLTAKDKRAAKAVVLDSNDGAVRRNGSLWMLLAVVRSHYGSDPANLQDREKVYRAGNALASWLGLSSWVDIVCMQNPENVGDLREILNRAK